MRLKSSIVVNAPREVVWDIVEDPDSYLRFMKGITRWDLEREPGDPVAPLGIGSRVRMLIRVGAAEVGGLIEVVECKHGSDLAWSSVTGVDQRGRWRLREAGDGLTRVELRFSYGVAGAGVAGLLAERVASPILGRHLRQSLLRLKRFAEAERSRRESGGREAQPAPTAAG